MSRFDFTFIESALGELVATLKLGEGSEAFYMLTTLPPGTRVVSSELEQEMLALLRKYQNVST